MNRKLRVGLLTIFGVIFAVSVSMMVRQLLQYREGEQTYSEAEEMAGLPDLTQIVPAASEPENSASASAVASSSGEQKPVYVDPYADALRKMDFSALRKVNSDVLGWILIPDTKISYPLVQGKDNEYYLTHTWKKWTSVVGAIFLECNNHSDFSDFNTILYGHRMNNGSMFAGLKYYKSQQYWASHPAVYITDDSGSRKYDIFSAYEVSTEGDTYRLSFSTDQAKQAYIEYCKGLSVIDTGITPDTWDRIITLSTCTGNGHATRWIVQAVLRGTPPAPEEEPSSPAESTQTELDASGAMGQAPGAAQSGAEGQSQSSPSAGSLPDAGQALESQQAQPEQLDDGNLQDPAA